MNLKKKCKVVSLISWEKSNLRLNLSNQILMNNNEATSCPYIHLYILSDENIKEGDWCHHFPSDEIIKYPNGGFPTKHAMKVIASTDSSLTKGWVRDNDPQRLNPNYVDITTMNGLPQPSPQFVEKFVEEYNKGNVIKEVNVDFIFNTTNEDWSKTPVQLEGFYSPKVDKNNFITITKIKESWNKDEIKELFNKFRKDFPLHRGIQIMDNDLDSWINENL